LSHGELTSIRRVADDRCRVIWKDRWKGREIPRLIAHGPRHGDDCRLTLGHGVEVTHRADPCGWWAARIIPYPEWW